MHASEDLLANVVRIMRVVSYKLASRHYGRVAHEVKPHESDYDVVTDIDRNVEQALEKCLAKLDPGIGFHGEEFGRVRDGDAYWLVDPIDGTDAFIRGLPFCTSQLALIEDNEPTLAVILELANLKLGQEVCYAAVKGKGAFRSIGPMGHSLELLRPNVRQLRVSKRNLETGRLIFETNVRTKPLNAQVMTALRQRTTLYQLLASGWELAQVAAGKIDGKVTLDPYGLPLDYAPGVLLIQEAGGIVTNHGSETYRLDNCNFIAANPVVHQELIDCPDLPFGC